MTIEEAIRHCEEVASKCEFDTDWGMGNHFIDRSGVADVIECAEEHRQLAEWLKDYKRLLEQQPCADCISRQAVLACKQTFHDNAGYETEYVDIEDIETLPSVQPQPKTGHWSRKTKVDAYDIAGVKTWGIKCQCDRCDFTTIVVEDFGYYNYCPNCGAKMAESEDNK